MVMQFYHKTKNWATIAVHIKKSFSLAKFKKLSTHEAQHVHNFWNIKQRYLYHNYDNKKIIYKILCGQ